MKIDGVDISALLKDAAKPPARLLTHYFGVQLQSVWAGDWKLIVPTTEMPSLRVESLWFAHLPQLFERQHRLWPKASLFHLPTDLGEQNDVAAAHPEMVARLLQQDRDFDSAFQAEIPPVLRLPGPQPPAPGQVRAVADSIADWQKLINEPTRP